MKKARLLADLIFGVHITLVFVILFGWVFQSISKIYLTALIATLASELSLGYCILTKWEFNLRKKLEPDLNYDYSFLSYYGYKILGNKIPEKVVKYAALIFLTGSLIMYVWNL